MPQTSIYFSQFIAGTTWEPQVGLPPRMHLVLSMGTLVHSLPVISGTSKSCVYAINLPIIAYEVQETVRAHLRHRRQHANHHLTHVFLTYSRSHFRKVLSKRHAHTWKTPPFEIRLLNHRGCFACKYFLTFLVCALKGYTHSIVLQQL